MRRATKVEPREGTRPLGGGCFFIVMVADQVVNREKTMRGILSQMRKDIAVVFEKDPAAKNMQRFSFTPAFMPCGRIVLAHKLYVRNVPFFPRLISKIPAAHRRH